jgi:DNA-binding MarR family transcriptional regulator
MPPKDGEPDLSKCREAAVTCACFNFRKASRVVTQMFDEALSPCGLRSTQLVMLLAVYLHEQLSPAELAEELVTDRSTLTRNLQPLIKRRLLRMAHGKDRRTREISLTPTGVAALADAIPYWENAQRRFVKQLGPSRWKQLLGDLNATVNATRTGS